MSGYVYIQSEKSLWTVGHYDPNGQWHPESDHDNAGDAALRCNWLNGGAGLTIEEIRSIMVPLGDSGARRN